MIGFQTHRDRQNFARYVIEVLGGQALADNRRRLSARRRSPMPIPIGIDGGALLVAAGRVRAKMDGLIEIRR